MDAARDNDAALGFARAVVGGVQGGEVDGFPNADRYQMLAYCRTLGLQAGHLIYTEGIRANCDGARFATLG